MNVKKAIKRIAALAAGTTMVTATIMGAMAYDLGDYPMPYIKDGVFNGNLVIGKTADVTDVIGAIDIAASLQAAAKTPVSVDGSTSTVSVTGGVAIKSSSEDFNFGDKLNDFNGGEYDSDDFPTLLADGTIEDDDGTEYDYEQTIDVGDAELMYGQNDDYGDEPVFYLDLAGASDPYLTFNVEMLDTLDVTALKNSESIDMFGKTYTFDPNHDADGDLTLYGSDTTVVVNQGAPVTVDVNGQEYTIEVLGGNTGASSAIIRVTGDSTSTKTLVAGDSRTMAGLDLFVDDVFISDIGEDTISVNIFVGSEKLVIPASAVDNATSYQEITIGTEDNTNIDAWVETGADQDLTDVEGIHFRVDPTDFTDPTIDDDWNWLTMGNEFTDDLFGFSIAFEGMSPTLDSNSRQMTELTRKGDAYNLVFTNNDGDEYDFELVYAPTDSTLAFGSDGDFLGEAVTAGDDIAEDQYFILESTDTKVGEKTTYIYEVRDTNVDAPATVTLRDIGSGTTKEYRVDDEIADTGVKVATIADGTFTLDDDTVQEIVTKEGMVVTWSYAANLTAANATDTTISFAEDAEDLDEASASTLSVMVEPDATDDIVLATATGTYHEASDTDGNNRYGISDYGTWFNEERDNNGDYMKVYYSGTETDYNVFLNGPDAVVVTSGASSDGTAYNVNEFVVGQIAVYDSDAMSLLGKKPLIVVGGPCVNTVAMDLMGNPEVCWEGFTEGKAIIKSFSAEQAILVAGYSGEDTTGAARVLADYKKYDLTGDEVEVIVTDLNNLEVNAVN
jgi:hypothetical protein